MDWRAWVTLAVVSAVVFVLSRDRFAPSITILVGVIVLLVTGVIDTTQAFAGFSNSAPITVAALFVLAAAVDKTGALQPIVSALLGRGTGARNVLARIVVPTMGASAFLNNTPIVAMLMPQISAWAERNGQSPSKFLMPLSFAAILGGVITLIGTSTNLVVSGLLEASGRPGFGMFELTPIGLPVAIVGAIVLIIAAPWLLPDRIPARRQAEVQLREFVVGMQVRPGGPIDGRTVEQAGLRSLRGLFLVEIARSGEVIAPVGPTTVLRGTDRLTFVGRAGDVVELQHMRGLTSTEAPHLLQFDSPEHTFFEAVVGEASPLVGKTLKEAAFRGRYQAAVLAIHRAGQRVQDKLGQVRLRVGDTLLLLADAGFRERWADRNDFLLVSRFGGAPPLTSRKAPLVAAVGLGIIAVAATGAMDIVKASLLGALLFVVFRILSAREARASIDLDVVIMIAASFGLGAAIETSGLAAGVAGVLVSGLGGLGDIGVLLGIVLATVALTELITNNAAAVLIFPIAINAAVGIGADVRAFALAVAVAASASFLTPIGYQTNTMVYGAGGYRFGDYARLGLPLTIIVIATITGVTALRW